MATKIFLKSVNISGEKNILRIVNILDILYYTQSA